MNLIIKSLIALALPLSIPFQAMARVDAGTQALIQTVNANGVRVVVNNDRCSQENILGSYRSRGLQRQMVLCPGKTVDAIDHATVRHETWHAVQHCINAARGTNRNTPVQMDINVLAADVNKSVPANEVTFIKNNYSEDMWLVEMEATLVEHIFTAEEVQQIFLKVCTAE